MSSNIDGITARPVKIIKRPTVVHSARPRRYYALPPKKDQSWVSRISRLRLPLIITGAIIASVAIQSTTVSQLLIVAYGIAALIWRIDSRTTFILALLALLATTGLLIGKGNVAMAQNFATNTFLLLVVGVITLNREIKKEGGFIYSRKRQ